MIFFLILTVRGAFYRKDFTCKKNGGTGLISEKTEALYAELNKKTEALYAELNKRADTTIILYFLRYIYSAPVTKHHQNNRSRCLIQEFLFTDIF